MKHNMVIAAFALGFGLMGCNPSTVTVSPIPIPTNATIGQLAQGDFTKACDTFNVAVGYYKNVSFLLPASYIAAADIVIAEGNAICSVPPANVNAALTKLNGLWVKIQSLTHIPGTP